MTACPSCSTPQPEGARFCFSCGATVGAPQCGSCGAQLIAGARFCMECGAAQGAEPAPAAGQQPVASRRVTSVLFGDLVGFTTLAEHRDQEDTRELLSRYFEECSRIVGRYGGTVEKFIGDAVMAVWGVPTAHEDDAERAVRAGLELVNVVAAMANDVGVPDLAMRVGIVTGEVAVTIGAEQQGMVAGDAVNTAARVQSAATPGQVWVDETTRLLTASAITYLDVGSHHLKGKADPVPLWSVHAVVAAVGGAQRADGLEAPVVGRDREIRLVKEVFHASAEADQPALLLMVGEPGVGKTRLAWEFFKYVDGLSMQVRWHNGRCVAYGEGLAYLALADAIRARLKGLAPDDDDATQDPTELLEAGLDRFVPDEQQRTWLRPRLGALLGIGSVGTYPREDLFSAWTSFLQCVGEDDPVVLVIDDAHHADDGLVQFVEHLLATGTFPCLVVLLSRPGLLERHPALATNRRATISHLPPLTRPDIALLLDGLVVGLPEGVRDALVARSEGIPLYAVETVRSLIDRDLVIPRGGQYVLADPDALDLDSVGAPASLQALIAARLDALDPDQHRLVERASVIGNVFSREEIAELCPELEDVEAVLTGLVHQQILSQMTSRFSAEYGQFQFVQSVVRQVAYATLSRRDRRALHLAVARQMETAGDSAGEVSPITAQHYLDAVAAMPNEPDVPELEASAIAHLERAASRARSLGAHTESASHLLVALDRAKDPETSARLHKSAAWALSAAGDHEETISHALAATEAYDAAGDPVEAGMAAAAHGMALATAGENSACLALVQPRWDALLEVPGADSALLALGRVLTLAAGRFGNDRRDVLDRRIQIAERIGDQEHLADALTALSVSYSVIGATNTSRALMAAAAELARRHHLPASLARCLSNLTVEYNLDDLAKALETGREAVDVAARAGFAVWQDYTEANLNLSLLASGAWDELDERLRRIEGASTISRVLRAGIEGCLCVARGDEYRTPWSADATSESDDPSDQAWRTLAESLAAQTRGDWETAIDRAVYAVQTMHDLSGLSDDLVHMWPVAMDLGLRTGDHAVVDRMIAVVDQDVGRLKIPLSIQAHRSRFGGLLARETDPDLAESMLRSAVEGFTTWGSPHYRARAEGELGLLLRGRGRSEEGEALLAGAVEVLTEMRAVTWLAQLLGQPSVPTA